MNHYDNYQLLVERGEFVAAARHAISCGKGKASRSGAWQWADDARKAAAQAGIMLDFGQLSWPRWELAEAALDATLA
jgi:hypothetical protein